MSGSALPSYIAAELAPWQCCPRLAPSKEALDTPQVRQISPTNQAYYPALEYLLGTDGESSRSERLG
jgi:hypothetical protein